MSGCNANDCFEAIRYDRVRRFNEVLRVKNEIHYA